jgi:aryl-alcohol dehydrogenase-like predicted oxidoreductase
MRCGLGGQLCSALVSVAFFSLLSTADSWSMAVSGGVKHDTSSFARLKDCPRVGLGLAAIGRPGYINLGRDKEVGPGETRSKESFKENAFKVMDAAWSSGVRYFDAARSYGLAEQFLSEWLASRNIDPSAVAVGSKWGYRYTADWRIDMGGEPHEVKDHSAEHLRSQSAESLALLQKHLRLYQIHSATLESGVLSNAIVLNELRALKTGRGLRIGLSLSGTRQGETLRAALACREVEDDGGSPCLFDCVQATFNLLEQSSGAALCEAREQGLEVIVKEAMANGRLLKGPRAEPIVAAAARLGVPADQLCIAAVLAQPFAPLVLSGAATPEQASSNAGAEAILAKLDQDALAELVAQTRMDPKEYWDERSALAWN